MSDTSATLERGMPLYVAFRLIYRHTSYFVQKFKREHSYDVSDVYVRGRKIHLYGVSGRTIDFTRSDEELVSDQGNEALIFSIPVDLFIGIFLRRRLFMVSVKVANVQVGKFPGAPIKRYCQSGSYLTLLLCTPNFVQALTFLLVVQHCIYRWGTIGS